MKKTKLGLMLFAFLFLFGISTSLTYARNVGDVVINEMMIFGTSNGENDTYIELKNMTDQIIQLDGWLLTKKDGEIEHTMITLPEGTKISPKGFFVISKLDVSTSKIALTPDRTDDSLDLGITAAEIHLYEPKFSTKISIDAVNHITNAFSETPSYTSWSRKFIPGDGLNPNNWFLSRESRGFDVDSTQERGTPGYENYQKFIVLGNTQNGKDIQIRTIFGELVSSFTAFNTRVSSGINFSLGDVDKNGSDDIVAGKGQGGGEVIEADYLGNRIFHAPRRDNFMASEFTQGTNVATCDFDGDGFKDEIAVGKRDGENHVIIFEPNGRRVRYFQAFSTGQGVQIACGNFDADPEDEIIVGKERGGNEVVIFEANGQRKFWFKAFQIGEGSHVSTTDIDQDGIDEILISKVTGGGQVLLFKADGTLIRFFNAFARANSVRIAGFDMDNDNQPELLTVKSDNTGDMVKIFDIQGNLITTFEETLKTGSFSVVGGNMLLDKLNTGIMMP